MAEQVNSRSQAGKVLGSARTESKARASRSNGKEGGRPMGGKARKESEDKRKKE